MGYSPEQLLEHWKEGKSLYDALWHFCDKKYQQEYPQKLPSINIPPVSKISDALDQIGKLGQHQLQKNDALSKLKKNLCAKIISEQLIAVGHPKSSNSLAIIPIYICEPEYMDLNKSSISGNGLDYSSVRVIKNTASNNKKSPPLKIAVNDKNIGRPSLKAEIIAAYEYLKKHGRIDYSKFLKSHTEIIQKTVMQLFPTVTNTEGMEHEAIRRAVGEHFKADRTDSK